MTTRLSVGVALAAMLLAGSAQPGHAYENRFGVRGGGSINPDQIVVGGHLQLPLDEETLHFVPNADVGFGDDITTVSVNGDIRYLPRTSSSVQPYVGGAPTLIFFEGNSDFGISLFGGALFAEGKDFPFFLEMRLGIGDISDAKFLIGFNL